VQTRHIPTPERTTLSDIMPAHTHTHSFMAKCMLDDLLPDSSTESTLSEHARERVQLARRLLTGESRLGILMNARFLFQFLYGLTIALTPENFRQTPAMLGAIRRSSRSRCGVCWTAPPHGLLTSTHRN
jgi:hypothetical protein